MVLDLEWFSLSKMKELMAKDLDSTTGHLRLKVNPVHNDYPEYIELDRKDYKVLGNDDEKFQTLMEQFVYEAIIPETKRFEDGIHAVVSQAPPS
jgi:hypothetical protein